MVHYLPVLTGGDAYLRNGANVLFIGISGGDYAKISFTISRTVKQTVYQRIHAAIEYFIVVAVQKLQGGITAHVKCGKLVVVAE